jgi:hypothetical protein
MRNWGIAGALLLAMGCSKDHAAPKVEVTQTTTTTVTTTTAVAIAPVASSAPAKPDVPKPVLTPKAGTLRFVADFKDAPLASEEASLKMFRKFLEEKKGPAIDDSPRTAEEAAFISQYVSSAGAPPTPPELPAEWLGFETVVVVMMRAPIARGGTKLTGASSGRLLFHPPERVPVYSAVYGEQGGTSLDGGSLAKWVLADLNIRAEGAKQ